MSGESKRSTTGRLTLVLAVALLSGACAADTPPQVPVTAQPLATLTVVVLPTVTTGPGEVLLFNADGVSEAEEQSLLVAVSNMASDNGLVLRIVEGDLVSGITDETELIVTLGGSEAVGEAVLRHPEIGFIIIDGIESEGSGNTYQVINDGSRNAEVGFIAGYVAALVTSDYRVGGIALDDDGSERAALQGFLNGVVFYCGLCRPGYPPFNDYPQSVYVASADSAQISTAIQQLQEQGVTTVYLSPGLSSDEIYAGFAGTNLRVIGSKAPSGPAGVLWLASIAPDLTASVHDAFKSWAASAESDREILPPIRLTDVEETVITEGRLEHIEGLIEDLASGRVDTAVDAKTGAAR